MTVSLACYDPHGVGAVATSTVATPSTAAPLAQYRQADANPRSFWGRIVGVMFMGELEVRPPGAPTTPLRHWAAFQMGAAVSRRARAAESTTRSVANHQAHAALSPGRD